MEVTSTARSHRPTHEGPDEVAGQFGTENDVNVRAVLAAGSRAQVPEKLVLHVLLAPALPRRHYREMDDDGPWVGAVVHAVPDAFFSRVEAFVRHSLGQPDMVVDQQGMAPAQLREGRFFATQRDTLPPMAYFQKRMIVQHSFFYDPHTKKNHMTGFFDNSTEAWEILKEKSFHLAYMAVFVSVVLASYGIARDHAMRNQYEIHDKTHVDIVGDIFLLAIVSMVLYNLPWFGMRYTSAFNVVVWSLVVLLVPLVYNYAASFDGMQTDLTIPWDSMPTASKVAYIVAFSLIAIGSMYVLLKNITVCTPASVTVFAAILVFFLGFVLLGRAALERDDKDRDFHVHHWFIGLASASVLSVCAYNTPDYVLHGIMTGVFVHGIALYQSSLRHFFV